MHRKHGGKSAARRLKLIAGQVKGLEKMLEDGKYCIDIINQSLAVRGALTSFESAVLENHLKTHVAEQVKHGDAKKVMEDMLSIYKLSRSK